MKSDFQESLSEARQADNRAVRNSKSPKVESERSDSAPVCAIKPHANSERKRDADNSGNDQSDATPTTSVTVDESVSHDSIEVEPQGDAAITPAQVSPEVAQATPFDAQENASATIQPATVIPAAPPTIERRASAALPSNRSTVPTKAIDPDIDGDHAADTKQPVATAPSSASITLAPTSTTMTNDQVIEKPTPISTAAPDVTSSADVAPAEPIGDNAPLVDKPAQPAKTTKAIASATSSIVDPAPQRLAQTAATIDDPERDPVSAKLQANSLQNVSQSRGSKHEDTNNTPPPASLRAQQVENSIRVEQTTGMRPTIDLAPQVDASPAPVSVAQPYPQQSQSIDAAINTLTQQPQRSVEDDQRLTPQIVRGLGAMLNQRGGVMTMRLDPPDLGELRVQMTLHSGAVAADFHASTGEAQALLDKNLAVLRHALEGQGLTVERLTVHVSPQGQQSMRDDQSNSSQGQSSQRFSHDAAGGESRGRQNQSAPQDEHRLRSADFASLFEDADISEFSERLAGLASRS